ncbi:hypothetical protein [Arenibacter certesii]|uniref:Uncharacterized protein n=1 Tax=Arenibacter certesii TaxID=228955 RepID=A0A918J4N7_9FLAO|nr:hypothetical protein [Arenibacter certesii]GGW46634.1 hypothetical protein GCM10007383_33600 [Arenibacter certesii]
MENNFKPIGAYELPGSILHMIYEQYASYTLLHAFYNGAGVYKIDLIFELDTIHTLYMDEDGNMKELKDLL